MRPSQNTGSRPRDDFGPKDENPIVVLRKNITNSTIILVFLFPWIYLYFLFVSSQSVPELVTDIAVVLTLIGCLAGTISIIECVLRARSAW